ncbi:MAG: NUDIX hydrolase [Kiritimatiellia bacterium]|jgi:8-oxo-dGTP diphosphatase
MTTPAPRRHQPIASTLAYILSPDGKRVLLVHRTFRKDDDNLGKYNGIGGKIERNEDVASGMTREIREETGLEVVSMRLRGTIAWADFGPKKEDWLAFVFVVDAFRGEPFARNEEGTLSWVPLETMGSLPMWKGDRLFLPMVFDDDPRPFHGFMRYEGEEPVEWHVTRI